MSYTQATPVQLPNARRRSVGLRELCNLLWANRRLITITAVVVSIVSTTIALILPRSYEATVAVAPVSDGPDSGLRSGTNSPLMSALGGLSELIGLSPEEYTKKAEAVASLQSDALTEQYIQENNLLPILYASLWDAQGKRWKVSDPRKIPTLWRANELFKKSIRTVKGDKRTNLVRLTIVWKDPTLAATWANGLVKLANDTLRARAITDSERNIAYLKQEAASTNLVEAQKIIYSALRIEMGKAMLAKGTQEYAFKVIDPALVVERPVPPERIVWVPVGLLLGMFLSSFWVTLRAAWL